MWSLEARACASREMLNYMGRSAFMLAASMHFRVLLLVGAKMNLMPSAVALDLSFTPEAAQGGERRRTNRSCQAHVSSLVDVCWSDACLYLL